MVLIKRKPVQLRSPPHILSDNDEIWTIEQTGEMFTDYDSYLNRREFYMQRKFTCEITGHSNLTFFDAMDSETQRSRNVESTFPVVLREPVLRKVQFSTITRIDQLVNHVYEDFKQDFFPGESVLALNGPAEGMEVTIREKITFPDQTRPDGTNVKGVSRYFVRIKGAESGKEPLYEKQDLTRDRKVFTKQILRSFLRDSLTRESFNGAPWLVKESVASKYKINREVPSQLQQSVLQAERKAAAEAKKAEADGPGTFLSFLANQQRTLDLRTGSPGSGSKPGQKAAIQLQDPRFIQYQYGPGTTPFVVIPNGQPPSMMNIPNLPNMPYTQHFHQHHQFFQPVATTMPPPPPPKPAPIKYPIEDLDVQPKNNGITRPALKYIAKTRDQAESSNNGEEDAGFAMTSIGPLLEIWNTLNVHCEVFILDSFTLDDFMDALKFSSFEVECELLTEVHCAVLKQLVNEQGQVMVALPELEEEDSDEDSDDTSAVSTPAKEPTPPARTTRSSLAKSEAAAMKQRSPSVDPNAPVHRAAEMLSERGWVERLKERDFLDGGWQTIIVGLLRQLSLSPNQKQKCDEILSHLAPLDQEPTQETAYNQYVTLDVNLRISLLELICMLAVRTRAIREYLEQCSEIMTGLRKDKIKAQHRKRELITVLRELDEKRKELVQEETPTPKPEATETNGTGGDVKTADVKMANTEETNPTKSESEESEEEELPTRSLRRGADRAIDRKRKRESDVMRRENEKKLKAEAAKTSKQATQLKKVLRDTDKTKEEIKECEDSVIDFDNDLREANCQRTKVLGRDRFWNRYYWFERNGMPYAGMPESSTAEYGYANGRIWVQGPDDLEREGFIDLPKTEMKEYQTKMNMTVPERKEKEEGPTHLFNAQEWGYFDNPDDIDRLIGWLDERGHRERNLRKELSAWKEPIAEYMAKMRAHLEESELKKDEGEEEQAIKMTTRTKTYVDLDATKHRCLSWTNSTMINQRGHLHSEPPKKKSKKAKSENSKVPLGKSGKPLTRQGTTYTRR
ncbi:hypothetical protein K402DRAFT_168687 [Aulographum hederae CBS 113979]|uniref:WAC domain-containing protein n=1 Tax=Aulographum hederae CBS 113979 TaxID=1176131 RepID=A0A6G1HCW6_9PEZI|nr:hypothetical protein K402DRAFT_168687 [Aulographum hederae CBS 113979]